MTLHLSVLPTVRNARDRGDGSPAHRSRHGIFGKAGRAATSSSSTASWRVRARRRSPPLSTSCGPSRAARSTLPVPT